MMGKHGGYASMHTGGGGVLFLQGHYDFFILICICICFCFGVEDENSFWNWLQIATQERGIKKTLRCKSGMFKKEGLLASSVQ